MTVPHGAHSAVLLKNGKVLVIGGLNAQTAPANSAELYDPALNTWTATPNMITSRYDLGAVLLLNGKVLVAGGVNAGASGASPLASITAAELYDPDTNTWASAASMNVARSFFAMSL